MKEGMMNTTSKFLLLIGCLGFTIAGIITAVENKRARTIEPPASVFADTIKWQCDTSITIGNPKVTFKVRARNYTSHLVVSKDTEDIIITVDGKVIKGDKIISKHE